ncbi:MAG: NAD(P)(+) transhydrogenase (Re/Si-specific) subunit beta [Pseudomonadota bacterium]|nr:NAD(P)(+) transhydrogenase (Re/Si-specific) subunit beta [Pseudomonadota bacterium]
MSEVALNIAYLVAAVLFIYGIKGLSKPRTAVRGNQLAALGMLIAIVATLLSHQVIDYIWIIAGMLIGGAIGAILATRIQMTAMPQLVALLNGFGGGASLGVALAELLHSQNALGEFGLFASGAAILIGAVTLTGSFVAFAKLQELISGQSIGFPGMKVVNAILLAAALGSVVWMIVCGFSLAPLAVLLVAALILGLFLVLPIGGADMPVVIALLNSYSGIAAAAAGFVMNNSALIITGALVGASGIILTQIMCSAMNRSLFNVLFGVMAESSGEKQAGSEIYEGKVRSTSAEELAMLLEDAQRVVVVPGFGMAMAQAQHAVRDLANTLEARGAEVYYGIHPVAGRMPGHMNVLLAEAEVPYDRMLDMDTVNPTFEQTDVAIVIGANDVTNPMAREDKGSPIYGMPILNVDKARTVVVVKRSLSPGFAGLPNPLFIKDNTLMLFGDGKQAIVEVTQSLKEG